MQWSEVSWRGGGPSLGSLVPSLAAFPTQSPHPEQGEQPRSPHGEGLPLCPQESESCCPQLRPELPTFPPHPRSPHPRLKGASSHGLQGKRVTSGQERAGILTHSQLPPSPELLPASVCPGDPQLPTPHRDKLTSRARGRPQAQHSDEKPCHGHRCCRSYTRVPQPHTEAALLAWGILCSADDSSSSSFLREMAQAAPLCAHL